MPPARTFVELKKQSAANVGVSARVVGIVQIESRVRRVNLHCADVSASKPADGQAAVSVSRNAVGASDCGSHP